MQFLLLQFYHIQVHTVFKKKKNSEAQRLSVKLGFSVTSGKSNLAFLFSPLSLVVDDEIFVANTCLRLVTDLSLRVLGEQMSRA